MRCLWETHFKAEDINKLRVKGTKKLHHANINPKKAEEAILMSVKADYRENNITWDTEYHPVIMKGSVYQEGRIILNVYASNKSFKTCEGKIDRAARRER